MSGRIILRKIGVGVVGLGRIGRVHTEIFASKIENAELVAVMDIVENVARSISEIFKVKYYTDYDKFLRDPNIDAVIICTPTYLHKDMIIKAAENKKHIMVEKPLAVTSSDAEECINKVQKYGVKLQVGYMRRFDYSYRRAKEKIEEGEIGKPVAFIGIARDPAPPPGWAADPKLSGGIFLDMLSHDFDIARWLMNSDIEEVYVQGKNVFYEEVKMKGDLDMVNIIFKFKNEAQGFIHGSRKSVFGYDLRTEILGTKGTIYIGNIKDDMFALGTHIGIAYYGISWFEKRFYDAFISEDADFINCIIEDKEPLVSGVDGLKVIKIAEACWKSYKLQKPIKIEY